MVIKFLKRSLRGEKMNKNKIVIKMINKFFYQAGVKQVQNIEVSSLICNVMSFYSGGSF